MRRVALLVVVAAFGSAHAEPTRRQKIEDAFARGGPAKKLRKAELRPTMKAFFPRLNRCYEQAVAKEPQISGVINTKLTIRNEPRLGLILSVNGFDTHGPLGESREFRACVTTMFESAVLPPIKTRGSLDVTYPATFARESPSDKDSAIVDTAARAGKDGRWGDALADAERGLELATLDGPFRRQLIEIAGVAACHLKNEAKARQYFALSSPGVEDRVQQACVQFATLDLSR
jgi:hypothetical protein